MAAKDETDAVTKLKDCASVPIWEQEMNILFATKKLKAIVSGKEKKPTGDDPDAIEAWESRDGLAQLYMLKTIDISVKSHIR